VASNNSEEVGVEVADLATNQSAIAMTRQRFYPSMPLPLGESRVKSRAWRRSNHGSNAFEEHLVPSSRAGGVALLHMT